MNVGNCFDFRPRLNSVAMSVHSLNYRLTLHFRRMVEALGQRLRYSVTSIALPFGTFFFAVRFGQRRAICQHQ